MIPRFFAALICVAALALAGCTDALDSARKAEQPLPARLVNKMKSMGMTRYSPIMVRIFKEEGVLEVWKRKDNGRYAMVTDYEICKWSGKLGPKFLEGDRQAPEGFYTIRPQQMNPNSRYYLSFNLGFPNAFDQAHGRTGRHLMVHGACSSAGCYSMTDEQVAEIYAFARDAFRGGQRDFQVQAFPFRMTPENMARYRGDPNYGFWKMLKEGHDHFELTKVPPKVDVCERRYVFNQRAEEGEEFQAGEACPPMSQPENLRLAYESHSKTYQEAFTQALTVGYAGAPQPRPSIQGRKEAALVAEWSKRRARGERVSREPPSLQSRRAERAQTPAPTPAAVEQPAAAATEAVDAPQPAAVPVPQPNPERFGVTDTADAEPRTRKAWWNVFGD